jgi:hypothetical protein
LFYVVQNKAAQCRCVALITLSWASLSSPTLLHGAHRGILASNISAGKQALILLTFLRLNLTPDSVPDTETM